MAKKKETTGTKGGRSRTIERQQERRRQRRRNQQLAIAAAVSGIAIILLIFFVIVNQPAEAPIADEYVARYEGIETSLTRQGYPRLGETQNTVRVMEFSSFACTFCRESHENIFPALLERIEAGEINYVYVPLATGSIPNAIGAARASICASEQDGFWPYHDALFDWHGRYGNQAFSPNRLATGITELGLNRTLYDQCIGSSRPDTVLESAQSQANSTEGYSGTPAIYVNGVKVDTNLAAINEAIDNALLLLGRPETTVEPQPESTVEPSPAVTTAPTDTPTGEPTEAPTDEPTNDTSESES